MELSADATASWHVNVEHLNGNIEHSSLQSLGTRTRLARVKATGEGVFLPVQPCRDATAYNSVDCPRSASLWTVYLNSSVSTLGTHCKYECNKT